MREILFRGKSFDNDEWVVGLLDHTDDDLYAIFQSNCHESQKFYVNVLQKTIGQYTGIKDKNGVKIFEGDLLKFEGDDAINHPLFEVYYHDNDNAPNGTVGWYANRVHLQGNLTGVAIPNIMLPKYTIKTLVVGNIHDNPELINK